MITKFTTTLAVMVHWAHGMNASEIHGQTDTSRFYVCDTDYAKSLTDYVMVGTAEAEIRLFDEEAMARENVATLKAALAKDLAESQVRQNRIREQISKFQALTMSGVAA